jgi:hypothetical protein
LPADWPIVIALATGALAAGAVYRRYGYMYAAIAAMLCAGLIPLQLAVPDAARRLLTAACLAVCATGAGAKQRQYGSEFPGDDYSGIHASAWLGVYAALNLHLFWTLPPVAGAPFYWFTFGMVWLLPAAGLWLSIRRRDRLLLDASLVMTLATLLTNKTYLGAAHKPWDPVVLGLLCMGTATGVRRWLAGGANQSRRGFTAERLLRSDADPLVAAGVVSVPFQPGVVSAPIDPPPPDPFQGGRSGGGGGGASF